MIDKLGTDKMPLFFTLKGRIDAWLARCRWVKPYFSDRLLQTLAALLPPHLPARMKQYRDRYEHHLMLKMSGGGVAEARTYLQNFFKDIEGNFLNAQEKKANVLSCIALPLPEQQYVTTHLALDIALRRNDHNWFEHLPAEFDDALSHRLYYGHFFCHVFHQDYIVKKGTDVHALKEKMLALLATRGAEYPAEHNVGHLYQAKSPLQAFYQQLDPTNSFNPGIGKTTRAKHWDTSRE